MVTDIRFGLGGVRLYHNLVLVWGVFILLWAFRLRVWVEWGGGPFVFFCVRGLLCFKQWETLGEGKSRYRYYVSSGVLFCSL